MLSLRVLIIYLIFTLCFTQGLLEIFLNIYPEDSRLLIEILIFILFFETFISKSKNFRLPYFKYIFLFVIFSIISFFINDSSPLELILFLRRYLIYFLFFYALYNLNLKDQERIKINRYLIILFLAQIPSSFVKFLILGVSEGHVGTIAVLGGSIGTIMPLFAISFTISFYLYKKKLIYILIGICFFLVGLISEKRALAFFIPVQYFIIIFFYYRKEHHLKERHLKLVKNLLISLILFPILFYFVVRISPPLNPDNQVWGEFNFNYAINYVNNYTTRYEEGFEGTSRLYSYSAVINFLGKYDIQKLTLGIGPGKIIESSLLSNSRKKLENRYGLGYGVSMIPFLTTIIQVGFLGILTYLLFSINLLKDIYKKYKVANDLKWKIILLGFLGVIILYFYSFVTYSPDFLVTTSLINSYLYIGATLLKYQVGERLF